jgi:type I restriction-modification system DNA methylase subunit
MINVNEETLKNFIALVESKPVIAQLDSNLQAILQKAEQDMLAELKGGFGNVIDTVADTIIENVLPSTISPIVEAVLDPIIESQAPALEEKIEDVVEDVVEEVRKFL